ncbi:hypothetical protein D3C81_1024010 [compost metagenome]
MVEYLIVWNWLCFVFRRHLKHFLFRNVTYINTCIFFTQHGDQSLTNATYSVYNNFFACYTLRSVQLFQTGFNTEINTLGCKN